MGESQGRPLSGGAASPDDLDRTREVLVASSSELADVRAAAEKWQTGLAGIAGGLTVFAVVKSRSDIVGLESGWAFGCAAALGAALLLSVVGALSALRAAYGMPRLLTTTAVDLGSSKHQAAVSARSSLRIAVWCVALSLLLFALALAIVWFGPRDSGPQLRVVPMSGDAACGDVVKTSDAELILDTGQGTQAFRLDQVRALMPVTACQQS